MVKSRQWVLTSRPDHKMTEEHFQLKEADLGEVPNGGVAVRMLYLSVDPTQRIWSSPVKQYMPNQPLNDAFRALGAGIVEKSRNSNFNEGDYVLGALCWQTHYVSSDGSELTKLDPELPIEAQMSALGMVGETAWMCLKDYVKKDDVVLISAALGGVGSIGGQLAKLLGAKKVVGIVGSESKVERAKKEFGYDVCINRNNESDIEAAIARESPEGVDVYLDNVGPPILDAAIANMNLFGRIPICGMISSYEQFSSDKTRGNVKVSNMELVLMQRLTLRGHIIFDSQADPNFRSEFQKFVAPALKEGRLKYETDITEGFENTLKAYNELFESGKVGKKLVKVSEA